MPIELGDGATVRVVPPVLPKVTTTPPGPGNVKVLPVAGPTGATGAQGPPGDSSTVLGYEHTQSSPVTTVQIHHPLPYKPAGIVCMATGDSYPLLGVAVSWPFSGVVECDFGVPFTGQIYLS